MADAPFRPRERPGPDARAGYRTQGAAPADRRGQQVRVRASSARPTPGDGDAGGDDQADGRAPARARRRPPRRWVRVRPAALLDPDRRQRLGTPGRRSTSKRRDCRSGRGGRAVRPRESQARTERTGAGGNGVTSWSYEPSVVDATTSISRIEWAIPWRPSTVSWSLETPEPLRLGVLLCRSWVRRRSVPVAQPAAVQFRPAGQERSER